MTDLSAIISALVATGREGDHWDFKLKPQAKPGDLIKDILCLANPPRHDGDRYIIYGVDDAGTVVGLEPGPRRTQADIVNTLSNAGFSGGIYPDIELRAIELQGQRLEVLVVKDRPEKPYYLQQTYDRNGVRLHAGTVYSRVRDSNTPSDQVASSSDIELMWRERFGLDQSPLQRVRQYLLDRDGWTETSEHYWHYAQFPEFTISQAEEEPRPVEAGENWARAATNPAAFVLPFQVCYHQTVLVGLECIYFDEMRKLTPAPRPTRVDVTEDLWFFSLSADTLEFRFLQFLTGTARERLLQDGLRDGRGATVPVLLFRSGDERRAFVKDLTLKPVNIEVRHALVGAKNDPEIREQDWRIVAFSRAVVERFSEWKRRKS